MGYPGDLFDKPVEVKTDLCAGHHGGAETSAAAFASTSKEARAGQRQRVLDFIKARPHGATCDEAELALEMPHQTCSARFTDLKALGRIKAAPDYFRKTRSGRSAQVYFAVEV